ncbi:MAG: hypothetical protein ACLGXA_14095 [Acidobacteriota bacterium]
MDHSSEIVDQFTRQAQQFAQAAWARNQEIIGCILRMVRPEPADTVLDVARNRAMFDRILADDFMDVVPGREDGQILFSFPVAILAVQVPNAH